MTVSHAENTRRIAKNTLLLYVRLLFGMLVSLYTSRLVLNTLGVDDYGINNVVGGLVTMFSLISNSLSSAVSRFMTFELGRDDMVRLKKVFTTSLTIHVLLALAVIFMSETIGLWFLNNHMTIPPDRMDAARVVFHSSVAGFALSLICIPYGAVINSHERMGVFALLGIFDTVLRLAVVIFLAFVPLEFDRLKAYSLLILSVVIIIQFAHVIFCRTHYEEARFNIAFYKEYLKSIGSFAGWNFLGSTTWLLNTQGLNILMNIFFGVAVNAARGIAAQVEGVITSFVNNFMTALNPQIIKSYATRDLDYMHSLVCRGAKFSYFLMFLFVVPLALEARQVLSIWLGTVPEHAVSFLRIALLSSLTTVIANSLVTAQLATGNIKKYQITVTFFGLWVFPLSYVAYKAGLPPEASYIVYFIIYFALIFVRIYLIRDMIEMPPKLYYKDVLLPVAIVSVLSVIAPVLLYFSMQETFLRLVSVCAVSVVSSLTFMYILGLKKSERIFIREKIRSRFHLSVN